MNYWLLAGPPKRWEDAMFQGVWGLAARFNSDWAQIGQDDVVFCYATRPVNGLIGHAVVLETTAAKTFWWLKSITSQKSLRIKFGNSHFLAREHWQRMKLNPSGDQLDPTTSLAPVEKSQGSLVVECFSESECAYTRYVYVHVNIDYAPESLEWLQRLRDRNVQETNDRGAGGNP